MLKRAHAPEDKEARREDIVEAAKALFAASGGELPTVARIAEASGLAKGTVYLYFTTREEIFAEILRRGWADAIGDIEDAVTGGVGPAGVPARLAICLADFFYQHPELLRLDALGYPVIERNLPQERLLVFKQAMSERLAVGGAVIDQALDLTNGRGVVLLIRSHAMITGLWRSFDPLRSQAPRALEQPNFRAELVEALREYWLGALHFSTANFQELIQ